MLGFTHHPEWDFGDIGVKNYRAENTNGIWRAHVIDYNGPITYVSLGRVVNEDGKVDRWRNCVSDGSVNRKING